ncbi:hypothetical protein AB4133_20535 [Vibrio sp. 10N.286.52.F8]|uniref:hypothetical protein n=1 Tax=Vibrio sp. 10N.286.52.F8 TaxID=3229716 RepID=UPI00354EEBBA
MKKITLSVLGLAMMYSGIAHSAQKCVDDPRINSIGDVIEQIQAGQDVERLTLTSKTYLDLTHDTRSALSSHLNVYNDKCEAVQMVQGSTPPYRIEADFQSLQHNFRQALMRGDKETADILTYYFRAKPIPSNRLTSMFTPWAQPQNVSENLYTWGYFAKVAKDTNRKNCETEQADISLIDLFDHFDGRVSDDGYVVLNAGRRGTGSSSESLSMLSSNNNQYYYIGNAHMDNSCPAYNVNRSVSSLSNTGANIAYSTRSGSNYRADDLKQELDKILPPTDSSPF